MSSNFLNKAGLSYFWQKIKEMIQGKQDKLTAGDNITIGTDNTIKAYNKVFVGVCKSAETDAVKDVSCPGWVLADGNILVVQFFSSNAKSSIKLNVEGTGAIPLYYEDDGCTWHAGAYIAFAYDAIYDEFGIINMGLVKQEV